MHVLLALLFLVQAPSESKSTAITSFVIAPTDTELVAQFQKAGFEVNELREDIRVDATLVGESSIAPHWLEAGSFIVSARRDQLSKLIPIDQGNASSFPALLELRGNPILFTQPALLQGSLRPKPQPLTFETVFGGDKPLSLEGDPNLDIEWVDDETLLMRKGGPMLYVNAFTGQATKAEDSDKIIAALSNIPGIDQEKAKAISTSRRIVDPTKKSFVVNYQNDLYFAALDGSSAGRLTNTPAAEEQPTHSPDGKYVAFVRDDNMFIVEVATKKETALTSDGGGPIRNGKADWVYWEEVYDRNARPFWWSPDSQNLVFLRFDDTNVQKFTVINDLPVRQKLEQTHYPKSGDPNPSVRIGIASAANGWVQWIDPPKEGDEPTIVPRVGWKPGGEIYYTVQNRIQSYLDLYFVGPNALPRKVLRETTKAWVNYKTTPTFLADGSFIFPSERTGWNHLYLYDAAGALKKQITDGEWEVRRVVNVDEKEGFVVFTGMKDDPIGENTYRVKLDGTDLQKTSPQPGQRRRIGFSPNGRFMIDAWSDENTPTQVALREAGGPLVRRLDTNPVHAQERFQLLGAEYVKVPARDGYQLEAIITKPGNFDAKKKYPVWLKVYGGPQMPQVRRSWAGGRLGDRALAQAGYVVFTCDPRSASGKGAISAWSAYKQLGVQEAKDLSDAITWLLKEHPYCDPKRVGMEGTSYGGYMTAYCMTHTKLFAAGIAAAAVTDWHNYDSFYTERYMDIPKNNEEGYKVSSVNRAASNLHGRMLLVHGMMDDNVHPQNALQLAQELQRANKEFEMMVYPTARHGGFGRHYQQLRMDFIKRTLGGPTG